MIALCDDKGLGRILRGELRRVENDYNVSLDLQGVEVIRDDFYWKGQKKSVYYVDKQRRKMPEINRSSDERTIRSDMRKSCQLIVTAASCIEHFHILYFNPRTRRFSSSDRKQAPLQSLWSNPVQSSHKG